MGGINHQKWGGLWHCFTHITSVFWGGPIILTHTLMNHPKTQNWRLGTGVAMSMFQDSP